MLDLSLFRRPAFVGAALVAFAVSASIFSMFLYLTLYLQDVLGLSPLAAGLRFLVLSGVILVVGGDRRAPDDRRAGATADGRRADARRASA